MVFELETEVYILDTAEPDATVLAWDYISNHRVGIVKHVCSEVQGDVTGRERLYGVEFLDKFQGGHNCNGRAALCQGQYITAKHLTPIVDLTVPNIPVPDYLANEGHA